MPTGRLVQAAGTLLVASVVAGLLATGAASTRGQGRIVFSSLLPVYPLPNNFAVDRAFAVGLDGTRSRELPVGLRLSADGRRAAYVRGGTTLWISNLDGSAPRQIANASAPIANVFWSQDGSRLAFIAGGLWIVGTDGSDMRQILTSPGAPIGASHEPQPWSPDGAHLVVDVGSQIWLVAADGSSQKKLYEPATNPAWANESVSATDWAPGTSALAVTVETGAGCGPGIWKDCLDWYILTFDRRGAALGRILGAQDVAWSPDGSRIAYSSGLFLLEPSGVTIETARANGSHARSLLTHVKPYQAHGCWVGPRWLDASTVAVEEDLGCDPYDAGTTIGFALLRAPEGSVVWRSRATLAMFSPDGRHVAFLQSAHHGTTLYTARVAGTTIPRPEQVATRASLPSWSRDGRGTLAFVTSGCCHKQLEILPPGGGPPHLVARVKANRTLLPFWVGSQLVYESRLPPQRWPSLWTMGPAGTGLRRLTAAGGNDVDPAWSPDGSLVAFSRERSTSSGSWGSIETVRSNGSGLRLIVGGSGESDDDPSWSPDGKRIVFVRRRNQNTVSVVNADGGGLRALTGKIYSASLSSAAWSPDGKSIAYQADGDLVVMSADGTGSTTLLTSCGCSAPSWSPSGAQLAFFCASCDAGARGVAVVNADGSGLRAVVADAGSQTNLFNYPNSPVWSPDGTELLFSGTSCTTSDDSICSISLDGSGLRALTPSGAGSYAPSWTAVAG